MDDQGSFDPRTPADVLAQFYTLGEDCELGFVQREAGVELLNLFRFIGLHDPPENRLERMVAGLVAGFGGLGRPEAINVIPLPEWNEYCFWESRYGLFGHTGVRIGEQSPETVRARLAGHLKFLRRKLFEDLAIGEKILVWRAQVSLRERQVMYLFDTLREFGPAQLVWIPPPQDQVQAGETEVIANGLIKVSMTRKARPGKVDAQTAQEWHLVCRRALDLLRPGDQRHLQVPANKTHAARL